MKMDSIGYAKLLLASVRYKPGWEFLITDAYDSNGLPDGRLVLTVSHRELDVTNPKNLITIVFNQMIEVSMLEAAGVEWFKHIIFEAIREAEMHELREWLKFDGENLEDPHPPRFRIHAPTGELLTGLARG
jgi:hypothetical protein